MNNGDKPASKLTKREHFAIELAKGAASDSSVQTIYKWAVAEADRLLAELERHSDD